MPATMIVIATIGTVAMLWVGGSILVHGIRDLGWAVPYDMIKHAAQVVADGAGTAQGFLRWFVTAGLDGIIGLAAGFVLIPIVLKAVVPTMTWLFPEKT